MELVSRPTLIARRATGILLPVLVFALTLALYVRTGAPTVLTGDQAEHQYTAFLVGVPHATGYPLFTMFNALAVRLLPFGDVARRVTLMTALWSALAVMLVYLVARRLSGQPLTGLIAAATLAVSREFWSLAVVAEVYTLQALLILLIWWCLLRWWERPDRPRWLYGAAFVSGIATTHHGSFVPIVAPALLLAVALPLLWAGRRLAAYPEPAVLRFVWRPIRHTGPRLLYRCAGWGLLGLAPWLYLVAQFALLQPFDYYHGQGLPYHYYWGNPASWADVANLALGAGFRAKVFTHGWEQFWTLTFGFITTLRQEIWWSGLLLGGLGGTVLLLRRPGAGRFGALVFIGATLFGINVAADVPKAHVYFLPAYVIWTVWAGVGAGWLVEQERRVVGMLWRSWQHNLNHPGTDWRLIASGAQHVVLLGVLVLPLLLGWRRFERMDRSADDSARQQAEGVLNEVAPDAVILCRWELCQPLRYVQFVEQRRLDVQLDQTEPEAGADWAARAALYLPQHPVYALQLNEQLAARYPIYPLSETYDLWEVLDLEP